MRRLLQPGRRTILALLAGLVTVGASSAPAQQVPGRLAPGGGPGAGDEALGMAASYDPERVRTLMLSIHGFTLAQLNAVSTDVPEILMTLADDGGELMLVRRQSIKGMRLYPTEPLLTFIGDRVDQAPLGLKRLYLSSLGGFAASDPARVTPLMEQALDDPDITVRYAALNLASKLSSTQEVQSILQTRLSVEPDGGLRGSIERQLAGN